MHVKTWVSWVLVSLWLATVQVPQVDDIDVGDLHWRTCYASYPNKLESLVNSVEYDSRHQFRTYSSFSFTHAITSCYTPRARSPLVLRLNQRINSSLRRVFRSKTESLLSTYIYHLSLWWTGKIPTSKQNWGYFQYSCRMPSLAYTAGNIYIPRTWR